MAIFILFVFGRSMCPFCFDLVVWYACSSKAANSLHRSYTRRVVICLPIYLGLSLHPRCSPDSRAWTLKEPGAREYRTHKKDFWDFDGKQDLSLSLSLSLSFFLDPPRITEREREREREKERQKDLHKAADTIFWFTQLSNTFSATCTILSSYSRPVVLSGFTLMLSSFITLSCSFCPYSEILLTIEKRS